MIYVFATITALPGKRDAVLALFKKNVPAVLAEKGCLGYDAVVDVPGFGKTQTPLGDDSFAVVERWADADALKAHGASAHMAEYRNNSAPLVAQRVVNVLQAA
ncbi:MAG: putative quinol monooxygenase [Janthinobacterium lividum]